MRYSIVVPVFNEVDNVQPIYQEVAAVLDGTDEWELIFIDDCSRGGTYEQLSGLTKQDQRIKVIKLCRDFSQTAAMMVGFDAAQGEIVLPMDGDLQNEPVDIHRLVAKLKEGFDIVFGWRNERKDRFFGRKLPSLRTIRLISSMTSVHINEYGGKVRLKAPLVELGLSGILTLLPHIS